MLLHNKNAIIYGAGGSIGEALAKAFAHAGARVFLTGRSLQSVQKVADEILAAGGSAEADQVDALDEKAINDHIARIVQKAGKVDISFNAIDLDDKQGTALIAMAVNDFTRPINIAVQTQFLTATAAGRVMKNQGSGVILSLTATPAGIAYPLTGGFGIACGAMEIFSRQLASEVGVYGIRVISIRSAGSPDSKVFEDAIASNPEGMATILKTMEDDTMLKKLPLMIDITNTAVFLASDMAGNITGVTIDVTGGTISGINYRMGPVPFN